MGTKREEEAGTMGENQYGGRKQRRSNDVAFINEMILEYHRMMHINITITQHDNAACFDITVSNITTLANRKYNIPTEICKMVQNVKLNIKYHVVTHYGTLETYYSHTKRNPIHGSGQSSGNEGTE